MFLSRHELCIHMNVDRAELNSGAWIAGSSALTARPRCLCRGGMKVVSKSFCKSSPLVDRLLCHDSVSCLPPKILHNHCFQFLLGITVVPREIEYNDYSRVWGVNKVHSGRCENGEFIYICIHFFFFSFFFFPFSTHPLVECHYFLSDLLQRLRGNEQRLTLHNKALRRVLLTALQFCTL